MACSGIPHFFGVSRPVSRRTGLTRSFPGSPRCVFRLASFPAAMLLIGGEAMSISLIIHVVSDDGSGIVDLEQYGCPHSAGKIQRGEVAAALHVPVLNTVQVRVDSNHTAGLVQTLR